MAENTVDGYLPAALCLAVSGIAFFGQMLSKAIQRAMNEDSVLYARCRGLSDRYIVVRYALPQAVISIVPTFMQMMGMCMAGSAIVENIFSLPGLGYRIVDSLTNRDLPVIYATVLFLAFALVIFNILADIIQRLLQTRKGGAA
ncbi:MAG: ABC transporter permease subunit [Intestinimonas butyriciproducens]|uniref:ABC transporter permease subunit n=1 Tax=Intestinimonas butyriciproducens TaxID=1297617 RepID=UPI003992756F